MRGGRGFTAPPAKTAMKENNTSDDERAQQLADIAASGDEDNAEVAAADLAREFPDTGG